MRSWALLVAIVCEPIESILVGRSPWKPPFIYVLTNCSQKAFADYCMEATCLTSDTMALQALTAVGKGTFLKSTALASKLP
jgi:hypothetical protein